jgi:hypothetical protein
MKSNLEIKPKKSDLLFGQFSIYCARCVFMKAVNLLELITMGMLIKMVTLFNTENNMTTA